MSKRQKVGKGSERKEKGGGGGASTLPACGLIYKVSMTPSFKNEVGPSKIFYSLADELAHAAYTSQSPARPVDGFEGEPYVAPRVFVGGAGERGGGVSTNYLVFLSLPFLLVFFSFFLLSLFLFSFFFPKKGCFYLVFTHVSVPTYI